MKRTLSLCIAITAWTAGCYVDATVTPPPPPAGKNPENDEPKKPSSVERSLTEHSKNEAIEDEGIDIALLQVAGIKSSKGSICYSIYDNGQGFPDDAKNTVIARCEPISVCTENCSNYSIELKIKELEFGTDYAIALFHDFNDDGVMETRGPLKIPAEDFGFSNNPDLFTTLGAPTYESCIVRWNEETPIVKINLQRLL